MRIAEILSEGADLRSTLLNIADDIGTGVSLVYNKIKASLQTSADMNGLDENGKIRGIGLILGGEGSRWLNSTYYPKLEKELQALIKQSPNNSKELREFLLNTEKKTFSVLSNNLPRILMDLAKKLNNTSIYNNAKQWYNMQIDLHKFIDMLISDTDAYGSKDDEPVDALPNVIGQQNANVESIINDVLRRINKNQAGEIRNILARSNNKLMTLQQELTRRGISPQ